MKKHILSIGSVLMLFACGSSTSESSNNQPSTTDSTSNKSTIVDTTCTNQYSAEKTWIKFGAFKTTDRKEVGGEFKEFTIQGTQQADTHEEIFANATVNIPIYGLDTKDLGRNKRIKDEFFGTMSNTEVLKGKVIGFNTDSSVVNLELTMNDLSKEVSLNYSISGDTIKLHGNIDVLNWEGADAIAALNKACETLHKGADGVSKTWPDVNIYITSVIQSTCK